ncbi:hypothetical protein GUJ93_ZPchr0010g10537 [Zizania palustris]|uniref:Uncharacterized protein n=1 Tax=Zizania palustris TaxID=103762 RepID=A0A8J5WC18_ZIZPA|nr:hypothetical protein GUJ93_ZPchr0010g10537 [Zizania palustris]
MAGCCKVLITCILIFVVISGHAEARRRLEETATSSNNGNNGAGTAVVVAAMKGDRMSFGAAQEMAYSETKAGAAAAMPMATTESRPTAPGNSPGIGNKGRINN